MKLGTPIMTVGRRLCRWLPVGLACAVAACGQLTTTPGEQAFTPQYNQPGKDVVWWPTPQTLVEKMLDMTAVTPSDYLIDLGSGDGRIVIAAAQRGVRALGIEYNPDMVALSRRAAAAARVGDRATFVQGDVFESDFSKANVITMFLAPEMNLRLRPAILALKPGTRIVSNSIGMGDWDPDEVADLRCERYCTGYLWIVPARVEGKWQAPEGELELKQQFQKVRGMLWDGKEALPVHDGRLRGSEMQFHVGSTVYRGRLRDATIEGTVNSGGVTRPWQARRVD